MHDIVRDKLDELRKMCLKYRARRLELFGSATRDDFTATSDLDFLVEFEELPPAAHAASYFGLLAGLEDLFGLPVDLIEMRAVRNPYVRDEIERTREPLYAA